MFENIQNKLTEHFPEVKIKYKNQSKFMKILSFILFFNKNYMTQFTTTIGNTIYFPSEQFVKLRQISSFIILMHELVHISDSKRISPFIFAFLYLFPQSIMILSLFLFLLTWKLALPFLFLCLLPIPAYFRMKYELRAYLVSLYIINKLNVKFKYDINLNKQKDFFLKAFKDSSYYFMWPFKSSDAAFANGLMKVKSHERPYEDPIFDVLDDILQDYK